MAANYTLLVQPIQCKKWFVYDAESVAKLPATDCLENRKPTDNGANVSQQSKISEIGRFLSEYCAIAVSRALLRRVRQVVAE